MLGWTNRHAGFCSSTSRSSAPCPYFKPRTLILRPSATTATPQAVTNEGSVLAYVDMLREYRVAQQALGTAAAHAARQLSSLPDTIGAAERRQRVQEAAAQIQVDSRQLAELIALRRRLLHDLPQFKKQMASQEQQEAHSTRRLHMTGLSCNDDALRPGLTAATQWANAKKYRKRAPPAAQAVTAPPAQQPAEQPVPTSAQPVPAASSTQQPVLQVATGALHSSASVTSDQGSAQPTSVVQAKEEVEAAAQQPSSSGAGQVQGATMPAAGAPDALLGTSGRLRSALSAALSYKQQKQSKGSGQAAEDAAATAMDEEQIKSLPAEILAARKNGNPATPRVELGKLDIVVAPRRSRTNDDEEGVLLLCPL